VTKYLGYDPRAEVALVVIEPGATTLARYFKLVGQLHADLDVETQRHRERVKTRS
jgi:hypothetical protein